MERLLNIENDWDGVLGDKVEGPCELIDEKEVEEAIKVMKAGKAGGPTEVVGEMLKAAGKKRIKKVDRAIQPGGKRRGNSKRMATQHPHTHF